MKTRKENWKRIENIDGEFMISDLGNMVNIKTGRKVGAVGKDGYVHYMGKVNGKIKNLRLHQLVYNAFGGGLWDGRDIVIDHINGQRRDNRIENLQLLKFRDNCNKDIKVGRSEVMGVSWNTQKQRWLSQISIKDVRYKLGYRKTIKEAKQLYDEALHRFEHEGLTPDDVKEKLPSDKKRCTICNEILNIDEFSYYKTCRGNISRRASCNPCYKEYRRMNDKKYRNK